MMTSDYSVLSSFVHVGYLEIASEEFDRLNRWTWVPGHLDCQAKR